MYTHLRRDIESHRKKKSVGWTTKNKQLHVAVVLCFTSPISPRGVAFIYECTCEGLPPLMSRWQLMIVSTCSWINICTWVNVTRGLHAEQWFSNFFTSTNPRTQIIPLLFKDFVTGSIKDKRQHLDVIIFLISVSGSVTLSYTGSV